LSYNDALAETVNIGMVLLLDILRDIGKLRFFFVAAARAPSAAKASLFARKRAARPG
jgi:hypothetical protein